MAVSFDEGTEKTVAKNALKDKLRNAYRVGGVEVVIDEVVALAVEVAALGERLREATEGGDLSTNGLDRRLTAVEATLRVASSHRTERVEELLDEITVQAEMALNLEGGFHKLEYTKDGLPFRWTGPDTTTSLVLMMNRKEPKQLTLNVCNFSLQDNPPIALRIDGRPLSWSSVDKLGRFTAHTATVSARASEQPTLVEVQLESVWRPTDQNPASKDQRQLGVAFHSLRVS